MAKAKLSELKKTIHDTVKIDVDNSALRRISQDTESMHRMMGSRQAVRIRADLDDGTAKARLDALTRPRTATVHVKVDKGGLLNDMKQMFSDIGGSMGGGHSFNLPFTNMTANPIGLAAI